MEHFNASYTSMTWTWMSAYVWICVCVWVCVLCMYLYICMCTVCMHVRICTGVLKKYSYPLNFSTFCNVSLFVSHNLLGFHVIYQHKGSHNRAVKWKWNIVLIVFINKKSVACKSIQPPLSQNHLSLQFSCHSIGAYLDQFCTYRDWHFCSFFFAK